MPVVDLVVRSSSTVSDPPAHCPVPPLPLEVAISFECMTSGFYSKHQEIETDREAARLMRYQLRSRPIKEEDAAGPWSEWPAVELATPGNNSIGKELRFEVLLPAAPVPLHCGAYAFSIRCGDEFGRWTEWSASSETLAVRAPMLVLPDKSRTDSGIPTALRCTQLGSQAALLEWCPFRASWDVGTRSVGLGSTAVPKGLGSALQRVAYRLRMSKRLAGSEEWTSLPITEIVSERLGSSATLSHEVQGLDERHEYTFHLTACWVDVPACLGNQGWTPEISTEVLASRLQELRADTPYAEVLGFDLPCDSDLRRDHGAHAGVGLAAQLRWNACLALRDSAGSPLPGSRYQIRLVPVMPGRIIQEPEEASWQLRPAVLEGGEEPSRERATERLTDARFGSGLFGSGPLREREAAANWWLRDSDGEPVSRETVADVWGLTPGATYRFSVRVGDAHRWSSWSRPSDPLTLSVQAPLPSPGDALEVKSDSAGDHVKLEWRPFRTSLGLTRVEYKIMQLEWMQIDESSPGGTGVESDDVNAVLARLRRAAELQGGGHGLWPKGKSSFREIGFVTASVQPASANPRDTGTAGEQQLRSQANRVQWEVTGPRPGHYCRFFICARYASLPPGSLAPLLSPSAGAPASKPYVWPDEELELQQMLGQANGQIALETSLSRVGLWSPILGGGVMGPTPLSRSLQAPQQWGTAHDQARDELEPGYQLQDTWHHRRTQQLESRLSQPHETEQLWPSQGWFHQF